MSNTDTPRTAKAWSQTLEWCNSRDEVADPRHVALSNLAEDLERELNAANARIAELENAIRNLRDVKGCYHSGIAFDRLVELVRD